MEVNYVSGKRKDFLVSELVLIAGLPIEANYGRHILTQDSYSSTFQGKMVCLISVLLKTKFYPKLSIYSLGKFLLSFLILLTYFAFEWMIVILLCRDDIFVQDCRSC
ncbi:hypothetical protein GOP47_0005857 [Adiantum capillus-veneris]|uniref:Uncharacterized protein n=1 Tax=Adiantum capillus-veneris TaxID=13818 RepID=A0A9D4ZLS7_ADICA|nr:hypothetical protein GOP47_0005857 [Adiantum capillus-veneris]